MMTAYDVEQWCRHVTKTGACPTHESWPRTVFGLGPDAYRDTIRFLKSRFATTEDRDEYYACIPYLTNDIEPKSLFIPWEKSPNCRLSLGMLTETPLESPQSVTFLGDKVARCGFSNQGNTVIAPEKVPTKTAKTFAKPKMKSPKLADLTPLIHRS